MPRGVAYSPEIRSFLMGLHAEGRSLSELSRAFGIRREVLSRWWQRLQKQGLTGLTPRSRRPHYTPAISGAVRRDILRWRQRRWGPARIAALVGVSAKTVHRVLVRAGQNGLPRPRRPPARRYEKSRPGELLHVDIKVLPALRNARYDYRDGTDQCGCHDVSRARPPDLAVSHRSDPDRQRLRVHDAPCAAPRPADAL